MDRLSVDPDTLFVYGSLQFPEVLRALLGRVPDRAPATVDGWRVTALPGRVYPGLVPGEASVDGFLITGLTAEEWRVIDAFEDETYKLRQLQANHGRLGWAYLCERVTDMPSANWNANQFAAQELRTYVKSCLAWRHRYNTRATAV